MVKKFSKDPKVNLLSIESFVRDNNYFLNLTKDSFFKGKDVPEFLKDYYKFTSKYLICIHYGYTRATFGTKIKEKLERIDVAYRDGKREYEVFDEKINALKIEFKNHKKSKKIPEEIAKYKKARGLLPKFCETINKTKKTYNSYLVDTGYKTSIDSLKSKYLVFDVETNGIRKSNDDLLSLSIYDPTTGMCYNRFLPLELQPLVLTTHIHGIKDEDVEDAVHMDQKEMNWLIKYFHLKEKVLLSYSGGAGTFDMKVVSNYCKRHNIVGFDDLKFENIKSRLPSVPLGCEGQLSKDNLCKIFKIKGIKNIHSGMNDCILEWKLFEKIYSENFFFINENLFQLTPQYIIPVSYLCKYPEISKYANIVEPKLESNMEEIYQFKFPKKILKDLKKYPTNITGISIEHGINKLLKVDEQDNYEFLCKNKTNLKYVGSLLSDIHEISIEKIDDGTIKAINFEDASYIDDVNNSTKIILNQIKPLIDFIKTNIFVGRIMSQELVISKDKKVLALCDLSDNNSILEIKTFDVKTYEGKLNEKVAKQIYYEANGRKKYILSINFITHFSSNCKTLLKDLILQLYKVNLKET